MHGAIYYRVPPGQEQHWEGKKQFRLGDTLEMALEEYLKRVKRDDGKPLVYVHQLLDRYAREVIPKARSARTRMNKLAAVPLLNKRFGHMRIEDLEPADCYEYVERRVDKRSGKPAITAAHRELEVLSHAYTYAVERWRAMKAHPFKKELRLEGDLAPKGRDRYVDNWEFTEALGLKPFRKKGSVRMLQAYIRIKLRTGLRMTDLLLLKQSDCREDGLHVQPSKVENSTGIRQVFTWVDEQGRDTGLKAAIEEALSARPVDIAPWIFCTDEGKCYVDDTVRADSFQSVWQRFMDRVLNETKLEHRFAEHDIRVKVGSDLETIEAAQRLLGHADSRTTKRFYRRAPQVVRPAKPKVS
jgi:integrase